MYKKIFISHSSKDAQKAMAICEMMEKTEKNVLLHQMEL